MKIFIFVSKMYHLFRQLGAFAVITASWDVYCMLSNCWNWTSSKLSSNKRLSLSLSFILEICIFYGRVLRDKDCLNDKYLLVNYNSFNVTSEICGGQFQKVKKTWVVQLFYIHISMQSTWYFEYWYSMLKVSHIKHSEFRYIQPPNVHFISDL